MQEYTVMIGGLEHTLLLSGEEAKRMDAKPVSAKAAEAPANRARKATANKSKD